MTPHELLVLKRLKYGTEDRHYWSNEWFFSEPDIPGVLKVRRESLYNLFRAGYIEEKKSKHGRFYVTLAITPEGRQALQEQGL